MPYLIRPPCQVSSSTYILPDEGTEYVRDFNAWGWYWEHCTYSDADIYLAKHTDQKSFREDVVDLWWKEVARRFHEPEARRKELRQMIRTKEGGGNRGNRGPDEGSKGLMGRLFKTKCGGRDRSDSRERVHVNHLQHLQERWVNRA